METNNNKKIQNTKLTRFQNNQWFISLTFKTYLNDASFNQAFNQVYINPYSYVELIRNDVTTGQSVKKFALNTLELSQFIEKAEKCIDNVSNNGAAIVNNSINVQSFNFMHQCGENFGNSNISITLSFDINVKKIFVTASYSDQKEPFILFECIQWVQFKSFINELKIVLNNWFTLQNQNVLLYNHYINEKPVINNEENNEIENKTIEETVSNNGENNTIEVEEVHKVDVNIQDQSTDVTINYNNEKAKDNDFFEDLNGFENDTLDINEDEVSNISEPPKKQEQTINPLDFF